MSLYVGGSAASAVHVGSVAASSVYLGGAQVWPTTAPASHDPATVPGLLYRWRADSIGLANGAGVASWPALAGGAPLTQAATANQPDYITAGIGGQPSVRFTSANVERLTATIAATAQPLTYIVVHKLNRTTTGVNQQLLWNVIQLITLSDSNAYDLYAGVDLVRGALSTSPVVLSVAVDGTSSRMLINGAQSGAVGDVGTAAGSADLYVGARSDNAQPLDADVAEILIYSGAKSDTELATVHSYAQNRYGIAVADYIPA